MFVAQWLADLFYNDRLTFLENATLWANLIGASLAVYYNFKASSSGIPMMRRGHFFIAGFTMFYVLLYVSFFFFDPTNELAAQILRTLGLLAWGYVWIMPARKSMEIHSDVTDAVQDAVHKAQGRKAKGE